MKFLITFLKFSLNICVTSKKPTRWLRLQQKDDIFKKSRN